MNYSQHQTSTVNDDNDYRYVGWNTSGAIYSSCYSKFMSDETVHIISCKLTELLAGVDPNNRPIKVSNRVIYHMMGQIYNSFRPATGDIYGRYNVPNGMGPVSYVQSMIDQTIEVIFSTIRSEKAMEECNSKLSVWTTILGDFNEHGLRQHAPIKIQEKRPQPMQFNMNY